MWLNHFSPLFPRHRKVTKRRDQIWHRNRCYRSRRNDKCVYVSLEKWGRDREYEYEYMIRDSIDKQNKKGGCKVDGIKMNLWFEADTENSRQEHLLQKADQLLSRPSATYHSSIVPSFQLNMLKIIWSPTLVLWHDHLKSKEVRCVAVVIVAWACVTVNDRWRPIWKGEVQ